MILYINYVIHVIQCHSIYVIQKCSYVTEFMVYVISQIFLIHINKRRVLIICTALLDYYVKLIRITDKYNNFSLRLILFA